METDYRFERVMKLADHEKQNLEIEYKQLYEQFDQIAHRLIDLVDQKESIQMDIQKKMVQAMRVDQMTMKFADINKLEILIEETRKYFLSLKERLEVLQTKLQEKTIEVKKYKKLKARRQSFERKQRMRDEMKKMDDIAGRRAANR
ncbi:flagellar export protein FliJ [Sporolactobacillus terrae]|uniref:flagellar export protein FliJ n=1 Tax=Sporolactobacillus terrae TaxID=269673 RepID=UPI00048D20B3|nr:flagellar export protein FliJ [Sporolactobacillus terrae]